MKTSKRLLAGTLLVILAVPVLVVVYNRFNPDSTRRPTVERTPTAELAALSGFTTIASNGDFDVVITGNTAYSVEYEPLADDRGDLNAVIVDGILRLRGFNNRNSTESAVVRIGVPDLKSIEIFYAQEVIVRDLDTAALDIELLFVPSVLLENNRIADLQIEGRVIGTIKLDGNQIGTSRFEVSGNTTITTSD